MGAKIFGGIIKMKESKVGIIISSYNQKKLVQENIKKLGKTRYKNYRIYFVDDSGEGKISRKISKRFPKVKIIVNSKNLGFSKSYNKGLKIAKKRYNPEWFLILNDDCELRDKNWLKNILKKTKEYPSAGIFGCKIIYPDGSLQWGLKNKKNYFYQNPGIKDKGSSFSEDGKTTEVLGAFMFIHKKVLQKVGYFDEKFSPFYGEESDLCLRARKKGYDIMYLGSISLIHHRNKSISKFSKEKIWFIRKKHSIRLEWKHYSFFKIIYYTLVHFGSIFKADNIGILKKLNLLIKAYITNLKDFK